VVVPGAGHAPPVGVVGRRVAAIFLPDFLPDERDEEMTAAVRPGGGRASTVTPLGDAERGSFGS